MYSYWKKIVLFSTPYFSSHVKETLYWKDLTFPVIIKWGWYFEYRAALLKVQNPKCCVKYSSGKVKITDESPIKLRLYKTKQRLKTVRSMITRYNNGIRRYEEYQHSLLIPDFENPKYLKALETLKKYKKEESQILHDINKLTNWI